MKNITEVTNSIKRCTANNMHTEAVYELAQYTRVKGLIKAAEAVGVLHIYFGEMTPSLLNIRNDVYNSCMAMLSLDEQEQLKGAF